jgi:hypothetical protein
MRFIRQAEAIVMGIARVVECRGKETPGFQ